MKIGKIINYLLIKLGSSQTYVNYLRKRGAKIGSECEIYNTANFGSEPYLIEVGNHVRINHGVELVTHDGGCWVLRKLDEKYKNADCFGRITIGNNVHIGTNSVIMPGVKIGSNVVIGCSSVVTHDIPDNSVWAGVPAKHIETMQEYIEKIEKKIVYTKHLDGNKKRGIIKMITDGGEDFDLFSDSKMLQDEIAFAILNGLLIKPALKLKTQDFLAGKIEGERK